MAPSRDRRPGFSRRAQYGLFVTYVLGVAGAVVGLRCSRCRPSTPSPSPRCGRASRSCAPRPPRACSASSCAAWRRCRRRSAAGST
ncbi:hypothetical protein AB5I41_29410 [Sphingomonas sp. MMS24-JH45]